MSRLPLLSQVKGYVVCSCDQPSVLLDGFCCHLNESLKWMIVYEYLR